MKVEDETTKKIPVKTWNKYEKQKKKECEIGNFTGNYVEGDSFGDEAYAWGSVCVAKLYTSVESWMIQEKVERMYWGRRKLIGST